MNGAARVAFATLLDLSHDGCAVRAILPLEIGRTYQFHIRETGSWSGKVVRRFDGCSYGVMFDLPESQKRRIDQILSDRLEGAAAAIASAVRGSKVSSS